MAVKAAGSPPTELGKYTEGRYAVGQIRAMCNTKKGKRLSFGYIGFAMSIFHLRFFSFLNLL
jgi:hypothetical protein